MSSPVQTHKHGRGSLPLIPLDAASLVPLYEQLYRHLRESITTGVLAPGSQLASTRALAMELGLSRFTVVTAMDRLLAEGYLTTRHGSGTFVTGLLPEQRMRPASKSPRLSPRGLKPSVPATMSKRGEALSRVMITGPRADSNETRPFHPRRPALDQFPLTIWAAYVRKQWRTWRHQNLDYGDPAGYRPLREAIAEHIKVARGLRCTSGQIIVTSGAQQAFDLLFRLLLDPGDTAWIEEPGYLDVRAAMLASGANLIAVPVDANGIDVETGIRRAKGARLAVVSPSHQYPTGATLSASRRSLLLEWARSAGAWIVEDDYDSYFRYTGRPLSTLQQFDCDTAAACASTPRVLYVGTFSKTMFPSLRLGFCVVPEPLIAAVANARAVADRNSPIADQAALAAFIDDGHYDRHLRRVRLHYKERYEAMRSEFNRRLRGRMTLAPANAGTHVVARFQEEDRPADGPSLAVRVSRAAEQDNLVAFPLSRYCLSVPQQDGLVLGYGGLSPNQIASGTERLTRIIEKLRRKAEVL